METKKVQNIQDVRTILDELKERVAKGEDVVNSLKTSNEKNATIKFKKATLRCEELKLRAMVATICLYYYDIATSPYATLPQSFSIIADLYVCVLSDSKGLSSDEFISFINNKNKEDESDSKELAAVLDLYTNEVCSDKLEFSKITDTFISLFWTYYIKLRKEFTKIE